MKTTVKIEKGCVSNRFMGANLVHEITLEKKAMDKTSELVKKLALKMLLSLDISEIDFVENGLRVEHSDKTAILLEVEGECVRLTITSTDYTIATMKANEYVQIFEEVFGKREE